MPAVTEKQAANLWCPMVRIPMYGREEDHSPSGANTERSGNKWEESNCIGSGCAMWRWHLEAAPIRILCRQESATTEPPRNVSETKSDRSIPDSYVFEPADCELNACWREPEAEAWARSKGYCGLAGPVR